ncbi:general substrate transporter [Penicillium maclennaniae]|uniref:general substrate transporter n=1 Tax=Penicillium maclennaniae TaxID=1343394 RepID=UPI002541003F|nr:general substrate transporter [Penicillium maclennaniae]KAJ5681722.1 general substrate transporter [Penicillium maclennaniae]
MEVLCAVYDRQPRDEYIVGERCAILSAIELEDSVNKQSFWKIFRNDEIKTGQRVLLAWGMQLMNQVGGIILVVYFAPSVLRNNVGMSSQMAQILGGCIQIMFMLGSLLPVFMLDRMGPLLSQVDKPNGTSYASASVSLFFLFMLIHGMSINSVPWVYVPQILPLEARTKGTAIGISSNWLWNFVVVMITPVVINRIQWKAYLIFKINNFFFVPVVYFFYPETSNLRLEDIDLIFSRGGDPVNQARLMATEIKAHGYIQNDSPIGEKDIEGINVEHV